MNICINWLVDDTGVDTLGLADLSVPFLNSKFKITGVDTLSLAGLAEPSASCDTFSLVVLGFEYKHRLHKQHWPENMPLGNVNLHQLFQSILLQSNDHNEILSSRLCWSPNQLTNSCYPAGKWVTRFDQSVVARHQNFKFYNILAAPAALYTYLCQSWSYQTLPRTMPHTIGTQLALHCEPQQPSLPAGDQSQSVVPPSGKISQISPKPSYDEASASRSNRGILAFKHGETRIDFSFKMQAEMLNPVLHSIVFKFHSKLK